MGCDIHLTVERRDSKGDWVAVEKLPPRPCSWCDGAGHYKGRPQDACYWCVTKPGATAPGEDCRPYCDRNYTVFSVLAGVRNDGNIKPIAEPRGLPGAVRGKDVMAGKFGDHSFSWLTLAELQAYDWKQVIQDEGWVDAKTFAAWDKGGPRGAPTNWCASVGGGAVEHVTNSRMREYIAAGMKEHPLIERIAGERSFYTLIQWSVTLAYYCKHFLAFMETLAAVGEPTDVRIVFGFDS